MRRLRTGSADALPHDRTGSQLTSELASEGREIGLNGLDTVLHDALHVALDIFDDGACGLVKTLIDLRG